MVKTRTVGSSIKRLSLCLLLGTAFALLPGTDASARKASKICVEEFGGFTHGRPAGMTLGPDNAFWCTYQFEDAIARFDPKTHQVTEYPLPPFTLPHAITKGPDGNLWFSNLNDTVGRINPTTGAVSFVSAGITPGSFPHFIITGPDGNIWFSELGVPIPSPSTPNGGEPSRLARININTGAVTEFGGLPAGSWIHGLMSDPGGYIWAALEGGDKLARFNLATGTFDQFVQFSVRSGPHQLLRGPNGNLYTTLGYNQKIGIFNPTTGVTQEIPTGLPPVPRLSPLTLTLDYHQKYLWFTAIAHSKIGRMNLKTNEVEIIDCGITPGSNPLDIAVGPDRHLWFTEIFLDVPIGSPGQIARVDLDSGHSHKNKK